MKYIFTNFISKWKCLLLILGVRVLSVFAVRTWYVPDEFWQSLEVAHYLTFGYGYLTWEWHERIRNFLYPLSISVLYKCLDILHLDSVYMLTTVPRIVQAIFTGVAEYKLYCWSGRSKWTLFMCLSSWFVFYIGSRTLLNTVEYGIACIAITQFPWRNCRSGDRCRFLYTIGLGTAMRPTFIIPWIPLCIYHLYNPKLIFLKEIIVRYVVITLIMLFASIGIDSLVTQRFSFTSWNFLKINIVQGVANFYGSHSFHWYLLIGLPTILSISIVPFALATYSMMKNKFSDHISSLMLISITWNLVIYSMITHKEFRFLSGSLPMILVVTSKYLSFVCSLRSVPKLALYFIVCAIMLFNLLPMYYFSWIHQSGTTLLMPALLKTVENYSRSNAVPPNLLFLMPCHSTPYYSHIHQNLSMRFLTCEPDIKYNGIEDEADVFYQNPQKWLDINYFNVIDDECKSSSCIGRQNIKDKLPTHLIMFDELQNRIHKSLKHYKEVLKLFHTHFPTERVSSHIIIYEIN
ncbi:GPI mannosyltransferase 3-like [Ctenocephalides felis]|uniref:GPI mannosyltransferase 3-like n=1 Tax=Ctenocephalides felis TaxID=7515 RepID=UPI000E6E222E|nr:GPI mannosyltransferase 3-like [Ctenocephalides felis]